MNESCIMEMVKIMDKFYTRMKDLLQDDYEPFIETLSEKEVKGLYLNTNKDGYKALDHKHIKPHPLVTGGYLYDDEAYSPGKSPYFLCGLYYIQEPSAMLVANMIDIKENDYVLDMCAAPGGKSCRIANRLGPDGLLIANDISASRAKILSENIERFGIDNTIVTNTDPLRFVGVLDGFFDKIILDAPCSGEGMLRKTEEASKTWSPDKVYECAAIQKRLIEAAYTLLKPGGQIIYSTCTYSLEENEEIVRYALDHFDFSLETLPHRDGLMPGIDMSEAIRCYPHHFAGEGQFMALLTKRGETPVKKPKVLKPKISPEALKNVQNFYKENLNIKVPKLLYENKGHVYALKRQFPDLGKIRILRNGLYLGESRKNYFIPSYSLALTLRKDDVKRCYDFPEESNEVAAYIRGETLEAIGSKGYGVIFVDGYPLSFYKESNAVKNLFPKGLRRS